MKIPIAIIICAAALSFTALLTGCDSSSAPMPTPPVGKQCTIQFRRDALGAGADMPVPPMTDNINGADTSISGTLKSSTGEWIVLDRNGSEIWIPKAAVLLIRFEPKT